MGRPGTYQLQAAILVTHAGAPTWEDTPWDEIVPLYDALYRLEPTPVVALNRGLALAERDGPEAGLASLDPLADRLDGYHLYHAARGELLRRRGRLDEARAADRRALELTENPAERRLLEERLGRLGREVPLGRTHVSDVRTDQDVGLRLLEAMRRPAGVARQRERRGEEVRARARRPGARRRRSTRRSS